MYYNTGMGLRRLVPALLGLGLAFSIGIWYLLAAPRLVEISPEDQTNSVPSSASLRLVFSQPMQTASVEERLTTRPARQGSFSWEGNQVVFTPHEPWPTGETVRVSLAPGARRTGLVPLSIRTETTWSFTVGRPLLAYLWPANGLAGLYALEPVSGETVTLLENAYGVLDFSLGPDRSSLYLSAGNEQGGSDLYRLVRPPESAGSWDLERILACPQAFCRAPRLSPDGAFLAYERNPLPTSSASLFPQVWILNMAGEGAAPGEAPPETPAGDPAHPTRLPAWSSTGLLAFYDIEHRAFIFFDPQTGESSPVHNETGEAGDWSPDGNLFIFPEILFLPEQDGNAVEVDNPLAASHLIVFDRRAASTQDISQNPLVEDAFPAFSPDGETLAFARKYLDVERWTPGRQVWTMQPDGTGPSALIDDPSFSHSGFAWSPDGRQLAYLRFNQDTLTDPPELWIMNADGSNPQQLVIGGYAPQWIP